VTPEDEQELAALGFVMLPEFIAPEEEASLLPRLLVTDKGRTFTHAGRNCVQRYGSCHPYNNYMISDKIPPHFEALCNRLADSKLVALKPDSVTINEYLKGQVIQPHVDALGGGPVITILSLGAAADMVFRRKNVEKCYTVALPPRSLIQMRGDLRYKWTHEILPVSSRRYSVVFRCSKECSGEET